MITVVSGLPRSGTSMLMRMLEAGGRALLSDGIRVPDEDNPAGYYEFERVKQLPEDTAWLDLAEGKVVKVISMLLYHLPQDRQYQVLFVRRRLEEVLASQAAMLQRRGTAGSGPSDEALRRHYEVHLRKLARWLSERPAFQVCDVDHRQVLTDPAGEAARIARFLGGGLDLERMVRAVEPSLYRQRQ